MSTPALPKPTSQERPGSWLRHHAAEILRGALVGLVAGIVVCLLAWKPCPSPMPGDTEQQVLERWGPPDQVIERRGPELAPGVLSVKRLLYRCGLFNTSTAVVYVDSSGKVLDVAQGGP